MGKKYTIEDMQKLAKKRGGWCLSKQYSNINLKLKWKCSKCSNIWLARANHIKRGSWCPKCGDVKTSQAKLKYNITNAHQVAKVRGGKCLSLILVKANDAIKWQCGCCKNTWETTFTKVKSGQWCPKCARSRSGMTQKLSIDKMQKIAKERGGKCLSKNYTNSKIPLKWECGEKHTWKTT